MNKDFLMTRDYIYLDNGATTLKPTILSDVTSEYYNSYSANAHRGDYHISTVVNDKYEYTRDLIKDFIGAAKREEIIFTSGTTDGINKIVFGYFSNILNEGDEVLITKSEHASNVLPWFKLVRDKGIVVKYIELDSNFKVTIDNVEKSITSKTKVISLAHITNTIGDIRPIKEISKLARHNNIYTVIDGAQSVPHINTNVVDLDIDFLTFSAHKMCGPTGVGVLYGKYELLNEVDPIILGGGMNSSFYTDSTATYSSLPARLEAGTQNIAGIIGFGATTKYLIDISMKKIENHEKELRKYLIDKLSKLDEYDVYNTDSEAGIVIFNHKTIFAQDLAIYLDKYKICVRAGNHCAKLTDKLIGVKNTVRISLYFYNTKEEIDKLVEVLNNDNIIEEML